MASVPFKPSDRVTDQAFNRRLGDQDRRIASLEADKRDLDTVVAEVLRLGLDRINTILVPAISKINEVSELGFLQATSNSAHTLGQGDLITFVVPEGSQRDLFTPTKFVCLTRVATYADYAIARVVSYDRDRGKLFVEILAIHGNPGPHNDWEITSATGAVLAQVEMLDQALAIQASLGVLAEEIAADHQAVDIAAAEVEADRQAVSLSAIQVETNRQRAQQARIDAEGFAASINPAGIADAIALRAPKDSPAFTGNPTAPTPAAGDSDASVATTAFVTGAIAVATKSTRARLHAALYA